METTLFTAAFKLTAVTSSTSLLSDDYGDDAINVTLLGAPTTVSYRLGMVVFTSPSQEHLQPSVTDPGLTSENLFVLHNYPQKELLVSFRATRGKQ